MACGKLFLLRGKGIALVKQDKWTCPLPPAPEGELTQNSIRIRSAVSKGKIKGSSRSEPWISPAGFLQLSLQIWLNLSEKGNKRAGERFYVCNSLSVAFIFYIKKKFSELN